MKRILVLGPSGSGKSTFAKVLADHLGLPWICLDHYYWKPNWVETPAEEWREVVASLISGNEWVMDGNYSKTLEMRIRRADAAIFLDIPRRVSFWRVFKRRIVHRGKVRPELAEGCKEKIDLDFIRWIWGYPTRTRPVVDRILNENSEGKTIVVLKGAKQAEEYLANLSA
ncbi:MAG: AAA family ATPase [Candidatus Thorarchaeota archaeon]|nr:MAG: AAA family ATPase [Candidatus Thorarchaeota archaeon]